MCKKSFKFLFFLFFLLVFYFLVYQREEKKELLSPFVSSGNSDQREKPLQKYSFPELAKKEFQGSEIKIEKILNSGSSFTSFLFSFLSEGKKVTGLFNLPKKEGKLPVILMLRGYVDDWVYQTGMGTKKPAEFFAEQGFITLAPDFLGFAGSDQGDKDILVNRFERPVTVLNLLASVKNLAKAETKNIFLWGHSNGGQIALSVLEIGGRNLPTSLWAPVTRGFPESVLNYSAQLDDQGKIVADRIKEFEKDYNPKEFSITEYFEKINAPVQVHLGTRDEYIKEEWIEEFVDKLKSLGKKISYFQYSKNNHQLSQDWDLVVQRDLEFFRKNLK